jgi:hypothetical protein
VKATACKFTPFWLSLLASWFVTQSRNERQTVCEIGPSDKVKQDIKSCFRPTAVFKASQLQGRERYPIQLYTIAAELALLVGLSFSLGLNEVAPN